MSLHGEDDVMVCGGSNGVWCAAPWRRQGLMRIALIATLGLLAPFAAAQGMKPYDSPYYSVLTDVPPERAQEAVLRVTKMFEEYQRRTSGFAGRVTRKMVFELHSDYDRYLRHTEAPGTAGLYTGDRLYAAYRADTPIDTWHAVQHEGFHQFVDFAMGRNAIPIWANEGLAEYFGESIWSGDLFFSGAVPPRRLERVQKLIRENGFRSAVAMLNLSHAQWNAEMNVVNYDQAWSMVHFLAHGDGGKYADEFGRFLTQLRGAANWQPVWRANFGTDVEAFDKRWREYWLALKPDATVDVYTSATVATMTSFYGRAFASKQRFEDWGELLETAKRSELKVRAEDWLPPGLLKQALVDVNERGTWELVGSAARKKLVCTLDDGRRIEGEFQIRDERVKSVEVNIRPAKKQKKP